MGGKSVSQSSNSSTQGEEPPGFPATAMLLSPETFAMEVSFRLELRLLEGLPDASLCPLPPDSSRLVYMRGGEGVERSVSWLLYGMGSCI